MPKSTHRWLLTASALFVVLLSAGALTASASIYHFYDGVSDPPPTFPSTGKAVAIDSVQWAAQSFRASASYSLTRVALWAQYSGNASQASTVEFRGDSGGLPSMAVLPLASDTQFGSSTYRWVNFTFNLPVQLVAGQMYWVVMRNATGVPGTGWNWWNTRADTYLVPGQGLTSANGGTTWSSGGIGDFTLRAFGYEETSLLLATVADKTQVGSGDPIAFTVWFNNTGTEVAQQVWINMTLPSGFAFASDNASSIGGLRSPGATEWTFWNVGRGSHYYFVTASVKPGVGVGQFLTVGFSLDYTDFLGFQRPGSNATFSVVVSAGAPQGFDPTVLLLVAALSGALFVAFLFWRGGRVEEVFLVHWSGVLVVHLSKTIKSATDRDILAGMLTTIQQFGREAFVEWKGRDIRRIDFGNQKIFLTRGLYSFLAVVVRGRKPGGLDSRTGRTVAQFERIFEGKLEEWDGALETLMGAEEILSEAMFQSGFARFTRWFIRSLRPPARLPPSFRGIVHDGRRAKLSKQAGLRRLAGRLKQRRELNDVDENYQSLVATALEEVSEGRFTVCGFANIYLATVHHESSSQKDEAYWNAVLHLIRDVMQLWKWDPGSQAWVSERDESSHPLRSPADLRLLQPSSAEYSKQRVPVAALHTLDTLSPTEDG